MQAPSAKKAFKISYKGETKRVRVSPDYAELLAKTRQAFADLPGSFKFFYLDDENEIISISSPYDYHEALENEDVASLKLIVATDVQHAREQLVSQLEDSKPLAESLNASVVMSQGGFINQRTFRENFGDASDFEAVSHQDLAQSIVDRRTSMPAAPNKQSHEIACGSDMEMKGFADMATDVQQLPNAARAEAGCMTQRAPTAEKMIDTTVQMADMSSQAAAPTKDAGCDGMRPDTMNQGIQMGVEVKEADVTCDLLMPSSDDDVAELEEVTCIKCNGSQMNKKGLPCRKCNGRGTLVSRELSAISAVVKQEVRDYCLEHFKAMFTDYLEKKQEEQATAVHDNVICDVCGANPIVGIRYKCSVRHDYDICAKCERENKHSQYPLLKIRNSRQAPRQIMCQFRDPALKQAVAQNQPAAPYQVINTNAKSMAPSAAPKNVRYSARFVKENFSDKQEIIAGDRFIKVWWLRNDGETSWPAGTNLVQTSGDDIGATQYTIQHEVAPGVTYELQMQCVAPSNPGKYTAFFRLQTGRIKFGHKVWCDILVVPKLEADADMKPLVEDAIASSLLAEPVNTANAKPEPVAMQAQEPFAAHDKEILDNVAPALDKEVADMPREPACVDQPMEPVADSVAQASELVAGPPSELMQSTLSISAAKSPKQVYYDRVGELENQTLRQAMIHLYEFGFTDFKVNHVMMLKHKDVNVVADVLMTGALSESMVQDIYMEQ